MEDAECPYCEYFFDVDTSDFGDLGDEGVARIQCPACEKDFGLRLAISYDWYPEKCDCWNGADHQWSQWYTLWVGDGFVNQGKNKGQFYQRRSCQECDEEKIEWHEKEL